jgi:hypothetical protein
MEETEEYIELPIDLETHSWFMYVVSKFNVEVKIIKGMYRVSFSNPADLYQIGMHVSRCHYKEFYTHYGIPK